MPSVHPSWTEAICSFLSAQPLVWRNKRRSFGGGWSRSSANGGDCDHVGAIALYDALRGNVFTRSAVTQEFTTTDEFYERKTLCRSDIEALFLRGAARKRFHDNWAVVESDLLATGMNSRQILALHNGCITYINARSSGEPGAMASAQRRRMPYRPIQPRLLHAVACRK